MVFFEQKIVGIIIHINSFLTDTGPLCSELVKQGYEVYVFANADPNFKKNYNPYLHPEHLKSLTYVHLLWYKNPAELAELLQKHEVRWVFTEEAWPFVFEPEHFQNRTYTIFSLVHSVDNFHPKAIEAGAINYSIVPYQKYGEYLGWNSKTYLALGLPKYDVVSSLLAEKIREKYSLPEKYILLLTPNNNLLNILVVYNIIRKIKKAGYEVVLKGKYPKCHKRMYKFLAKKYFLSDVSFYPFITHELICASEGVVGFDTTAVEETLMLEKPLVNFSVKPYRDKASREGNFKQFVPMWGSEFCLDLDIKDYHGLNIFKKIPQFTHHFEKQFNYKKIQQEVFSVPGRASERIIEYLSNH